MTISYSWLSEYLPETIAPEKLSKILTSIGLEVEASEIYESIPGALEGLVIGEVLTCEPHTNSDHLHVTTVDVGKDTPLQIVCGAPNVAAGQKVVVATVGTTIHPLEEEPITMRKAKIRGVESFGMICAEDEIGVGKSHDGIIVLPSNLKPGTPAADYFKVTKDTLFQIGLTPNRMDAMSHIGCAKDVCAYLSRHQSQDLRCKMPSVNAFHTDNQSLPIKVTIENTEDCPRYTGVSISGVTIGPSPAWMQEKLRSIGVHPINNVVDITNFVLNELGQPLHAFDADTIKGHEIIVKNLPQDTLFTTLDGKERKLNSTDLMICDAEKGLCMAGVFGGLGSGISDKTTNIFIESAYFRPTPIRRSSVFHNLRTDAAQHFEKGVDISGLITALKRAALLIKEYAGGTVSSDIVDVYPQPKEKTEVCLKYHFLKKLSGKNYHPDTVKRILEALGFEIIKEGIDELWVAVPFSKPDISLPADIVEEIVRIDGLDNIDIPTSIQITPAVDHLREQMDIQEKTAAYLAGVGFHEIMTNSITNSNYYPEETLAHSIKMLNSLSAGLNVMRPSMLETGLEVIAYNSKRKMANLRLFEYGKTYHSDGVGKYSETAHLALYITGKDHEDSWQEKGRTYDFYYAKGIVSAIAQLNGQKDIQFLPLKNEDGVSVTLNEKPIGSIISVSEKKLKDFDIKAPVYYIDLETAPLISLIKSHSVLYNEVPRFPSVSRDLAMVVERRIPYSEIEQVVKNARLSKLENIRLFDIFENDKIGTDKKSIAINFTFQDAEKTLTDKEIDHMMNRLVSGLEKELGAEIRK